jgi:hypothetical protein
MSLVLWCVHDAPHRVVITPPHAPSRARLPQVYDLSKLEGDEYGLAGASPPALRDTSSL